MLAWYTLFTMNKHSAMNKKVILKWQSNKNRTLNVRELPTVLKPEKAKTVPESWKMLNNEKEVQNGASN